MAVSPKSLCHSLMDSNGILVFMVCHGAHMIRSTYGYGSIPINTIFSGMNIHLPAILMFTRATRFWPIPICLNVDHSEAPCSSCHWSQPPGTATHRSAGSVVRRGGTAEHGWPHGDQGRLQRLRLGDRTALAKDPWFTFTWTNMTYNYLLNLLPTFFRVENLIVVYFSGWSKIDMFFFKKTHLFFNTPKSIMTNLVYVGKRPVGIHSMSLSTGFLGAINGPKWILSS